MAVDGLREGVGRRAFAGGTSYRKAVAGWRDVNKRAGGRGRVCAWWVQVWEICDLSPRKGKAGQKAGQRAIK